MGKMTFKWLAAALCAASLTTAFAQEESDWIDPDGTVRLTLDPAPEPGSVRVVIGDTDFTGQLRQSANGRIEVTGSPVTFPSGEQSMTVYRVGPDGSWTEVSSAPIRVLTPAGFETSEFTPRADLNNESQHAEEVTGDAFPSDPDEYYRLASNAGLATRHVRSGWTVTSDWSFNGNSQRTSALQFGNKGSEAPKFDLASYYVELAGPLLTVGVGHVSLGRNALLMNGVSNRGIVATVKPLSWLDFSVGAVNGTSIVGFDQFLGIQTRDNLMTGYSVGVDIPTGGLGDLRLEVSATDSELEPQAGFDVGEVVDSERSRGRGARVAYSTPGGSFSFEGLYANSRYTNPFDPSLALNGDLVAVQETDNAAQQVQLNWSPLAGFDLGGFTLNLSGSHARADPLYRTIGAFVSGDQQQDSISLGAGWGLVSLTLSGSQARDNLDDIPTLLTTKTRTRAASLNFALDQLGFARNEAGDLSWMPALELSHDRTHQFATNSPDAADSGFNSGNHLPDQVTARTGAGLSWSIGASTLGYRLDLSDQDNRQAGRENADFENLVHNFDVRAAPLDSLSLELSFSVSDNDDEEQALTRTNRSMGAGVSWRFLDDASLSARWFDSADDDSLGIATAATKSGEASLQWGFKLPLGGERAVPFNVFLRYAQQENESQDNVFGFSSAGKNWTVNSGVSATLF